MHIVHEVCCVIWARLRGSTTLFQAAVALLASILQGVIEPWWDEPTKVAKSLKENYLRRVEAGTRSIEAEADQKTAQARLAHLEVAKVARAIMQGTRGRRRSGQKSARPSGNSTLSSRQMPKVHE